MPWFELEEKFYRVELDGTRVDLSWGRLGQGGTHEKLVFETEAEAREEYARQISRRREGGFREMNGESATTIAAHDRAMAELVERGLRLEQLGREVTVHGRSKPSLSMNASLEAELAADPYDGDAWMVFEDWLLEAEDPRAALVRAEQTGDRTEIDDAYARSFPLLFGQRHAAIVKALREPTLRAGFLLAARFAPERLHGELLAALLASPAGRLIRALDLAIPAPSELRPIVEQLCAAPCARSLRELTLSPLVAMGRTQLDGATLGRLRLERLAVRGSPLTVQYAENLAPLRRLELLTDDTLDVLAHPFPELRTLVVDVSALEDAVLHSPAIRVADLAALLATDAAPRLENLHLPHARRRTANAMIDVLEASKLLPQLRVLDLGEKRVSSDQLGPSFAHLEVVSLPEA